MANIDTLNSQLAAVGDAIRAKLETQDTYKISEMPDAIASITTGGTIESKTITVNGTYNPPSGVDGFAPVVVNVPSSGAPSAEDLTFTGDLAYLNYNGKFDWLFGRYSNLITIRGLGFQSSFNGSKLEDLSNFTFTIVPSGNGIQMLCLFQNCNFLKKLPIIEINNGVPAEILDSSCLFQNCYRLREIPNNWSSNLLFSYNGQKNNIFDSCYSLRQIPQSWLEEINSIYNFTGTFCQCASLNEIINFNPCNSTFSKNVLVNFLINDCRLKNFTFKTDNGVPYVRNWKKQILDLSSVGYCVYESLNKNWILNHNSGITADKEVTDAASYEALKNDPDWFTANIAYSRYNHDSAVATINSLPDTSTVATGTNINTIKFKGDAGSATDGGAINTLTAEEIAVATAKGWTVTLT